MAQYERVHSGAAERIFTSFERQVEYRHGLESKVVDADVWTGERDSQDAAAASTSRSSCA